MNNKGFTILEMLIAVTIFTLVVASASGLFVSSLKAQRSTLAYQQLLDQTSYLMEYMSRAVRMAKKDITGACTGTAKLNYVFSGQCLKFMNYKNPSQCQQFCLVGSRIVDENGNYLTASDLKVTSFNVSLSGQTQSDDLQPKVTVLLNIQGRENSKIKIQTTISQRNLDIKR